LSASRHHARPSHQTLTSRISCWKQAWCKTRNPRVCARNILEQLGGTQSIIRSRPIIAEASRLYSDPISERPKKGAAGKGGGSIRRFARVLRQLDLTFDAAYMPPGGLSSVLPHEFDGWKKSSP